jgi:phosphoenolpyruvate synthase/pyruvate phosphate dikinase
MFIKFINHISNEDEELISEKDYILSKICQNINNISIPSTFIINKNAFTNLLKSNNIKQYMKDCLKEIDVNNQNERDLFIETNKIRNKILHSRINLDFMRELSYAYEYLEFNDKENLLVNVYPNIEINGLDNKFFLPHTYHLDGITGIINIRKFVKKLYANIFSMKFIKFIVNNNIDIYQIKFSIKIQKTLNNEFNENTISFEDNQKKILEKLTSKKIIPIFKLNTEQNKKYLIDIKILDLNMKLP